LPVFQQQGQNRNNFQTPQQQNTVIFSQPRLISEGIVRQNSRPSQTSQQFGRPLPTQRNNQQPFLSNNLLSRVNQQGQNVLSQGNQRNPQSFFGQNLRQQIGRPLPLAQGNNNQQSTNFVTNQPNQRFNRPQQVGVPLPIFSNQQSQSFTPNNQAAQNSLNLQNQSQNRFNFRNQNSLTQVQKE